MGADDGFSNIENDPSLSLYKKSRPRLGPPLKANKLINGQSLSVSASNGGESDFELNKRKYTDEAKSIEQACMKHAFPSKVKTIGINNSYYCVLEEIGKGASAKIYSGVCLSSLSLVAIKIFTSTNEDSFLCEHEYRVLESLLDCLNCIQVIDASIPKGILVLERGECTLSALLTQERIGSIPFISFFFPQVVQAVSSVHRANIIHCDLKPSNFVVCKGSILKLIDFGISKWIVSEDDIVLVDKDNQMGTLSYMAPESLKIASSDQFDSAPSFVQMGTPADIWAIGCILHEMMLGILPFSQNAKSQKEKVAMIINSEVQVDIPIKTGPKNDAWNHYLIIALACLQKKPANRIKMPELLSKACYPS